MKYSNVIEYTPHNYTIEIKIEPDDYYIHAISFKGSRHFSEHMSYKEALNEFPKYEATIDYFGGGYITLCRGDEIIDSKVVIN